MPSADCTIRLGDWQHLAAEAVPVRMEVFVTEQRVPVELEVDEWDESSLHAIACDADGVVVGTGRLLPDGHIGRLAVLRRKRGSGVGTRILLALMEAARERGHRDVVLSAQLHAVPFYRRHGFAEEGEPFDDAGIEHISMRRAL
jgi:predicted GNAT family N-acyltransferase